MNKKQRMAYSCFMAVEHALSGTVIPDEIPPGEVWIPDTVTWKTRIEVNKRCQIPIEDRQFEVFIIPPLGELA